MTMEEFKVLIENERRWAKPFMPHVLEVFGRINESNVKEHGYDLVKKMSKACEKARLDRKLILDLPSQFPSASFGGILTDSDVLKINNELRDYHF